MQKRAFLSPIINPLVVTAIRLLLPFAKNKMLGGLSVHIADEDLEKLRAYQGKRMLLLPNHPNGDEPLVLFDVSRRLNEVFNFVAAREVFDWEHGFRGWVLRRCGAYSVIRGAADRESFMMTKKILMQGLNRLVIFIEGEISRGNETLIPFEAGVIQLAFWAQEGLAKEYSKSQKKQAAQTLKSSSPSEQYANSQNDYPEIYLAPIAIKYFYAPGSETAIEQSLQGLELAVGLEPPPSKDFAGVDESSWKLQSENWKQRIRLVGDAVLKVQEEIHKIEAFPETSVTERVHAIKNRMLKKMELFLDLKSDPNAQTLNRLREVRNTMDHLIHSYENPEELNAYQKRMIEHLRTALSEFYTDLDRVIYFLTYDEAYLQEKQTPERFIDMLRRLEREVLGASKLSHPRTAVVKVGEIINLKDNFGDYEADKKKFVKSLANQLEVDMEQLLANTNRP